MMHRTINIKLTSVLCSCIGSHRSGGSEQASGFSGCVQNISRLRYTQLGARCVWKRHWFR